MTTSNFIELVLLVVSLIAATAIIRCSNQKVKDIDGFGEVKKQEDKGKVVIPL